MKRVLILLSLVLLTLATSALADDFVTRLDYYYPRFDWRGAVAEVLKDPELSRREVPLMRAQAQKVDRDRKFVLNFYADFVERVLWLKAGDPDPGKQNTSWSDTPIAQLPGEIEVEAELTDARRYWQQAGLALEVGAYRIAERWLRRAIMASHRVAWAGREVPSDLVRLQERYRFYLMALTETGYIYPQSADYVLVGEMQRGEKEGALLGLMAFVQSGRLDFKPKTVDKYLPRLLQNARGPTLFAARTFQAERRLQQEELTWTQFQKLHNEVWALFESPSQPSSDPLVQPLQERWRSEAAQVWLDELERWRFQGEKGAETLLQEDLKRVSSGVNGWMPVRQLLSQAESASLRGDLKVADHLIAQAEATLNSLDREKEEQFWTLAQKEKYIPAKSSTTLGKLHALVLRAKLSMLLNNPAEPTRDELRKAHGLLIRLRQKANLFDEDIGLLNLMLRYHFMALEKDEVPEVASETSLRFDTIAAPAVYNDPVMRAEIFTLRARLVAHQGRTEKARELLEMAVADVEAYLKDSRSSPSRVRRIRSRAREAYRALAEIMLKAGENEKALDVLSRLAQVENQGIVQQAVSHNLTPQGSATLKKVARLEAASERLETQSVQTARSTAVTRAEDSKVVAELLADTKARYYQTVKALEKSEPEFSRLTIRPLNFAQLQRAIPNRTAVLQFFPSQEKLFIFVADNQALKVRSVDIGREELNLKIDPVLRSLSRGSDNPALKVQLAELGAILIAPVSEDLQEIDTLAVIPSGPMSYLPFSALILEGGDERPKYLVERFRTATILKAVDLDGLLSPPVGKGSTLVGVGNPDGTLQSAEEEVEAIGRLFEESKVITLKQATRTRFEELCASHPAFLHIATHGTVNPREPLESFLVLNDGPLTLSEITGLDLGSPNLVALSACQTGIGESKAEPGQDLTTLAEAFWFAGGRSLLASLWSVSDESTSQLMVRFYAQLRKNQSKAEALQRAQLTLLSRPETQAPFYWAPFILIGDWR